MASPTDSPDRAPREPERLGLLVECKEPRGFNISSAMPKSRDVASRASTSIATKESGISLGCSMPWHRIIISSPVKNF